MSDLSPAERVADWVRARPRRERGDLHPASWAICAVLAAVSLEIVAGIASGISVEANGARDVVLVASQWVEPPFVAVALLLACVGLWYLTRRAQADGSPIPAGLWRLALWALLAGIACIVAGGLFVISLWRPEGALGIAAQIYVVAVGTAQVVLSGTAVVIAQQTCRSTESALAGDDSDFEEEGISR